MGTTLTGTTPQDTYDSLIKVTNNGPLSSTARYLSDGLGNDSVLALSTTAVGVGTATPNTKLTVFQSGASGIAAMDISGGGTGAGALQISAGRVLGTTSFDLIQNNAGAFINQRDNNPLGILVNGSERLSITSAGNVGIGTSSPSRVLTLKNNAGATNGISFQSLASTSEIAAIECNQNLDTIDFEMVSNFAGNGFRFLTGSPTLVERARFTANGLTFNGDTAAANALDDYEEGTWTMGVSFGGASVGVTYGVNTGTYTKIGRQVTVNGYLTLSNKGSSTGNAFITGLPFSLPNSTSNFAACTIWTDQVTFADAIQAYADINTTLIALEETTNAGITTRITDADFSNSSGIIVNITYFV